jgi:hypothetical protein
MIISQKLTSVFVHLVLFVFYGNNRDYDFNQYDDPKMNKLIKSKENCERAKALLERTPDKDYVTQIINALNIINTYQNIEPLEIEINMAQKMYLVIVNNSRNYLVRKIDEILNEIQAKAGGAENFMIDKIVSHTNSLRVKYAITDVSVNQDSYLVKARDEAKRTGKKYENLHDDYLEGKYDPQEDYYYDDEYGIRRYDRSKAAIGRANKQLQQHQSSSSSFGQPPVSQMEKEKHRKDEEEEEDDDDENNNDNRKKKKANRP